MKSLPDYLRRVTHFVAPSLGVDAAVAPAIAGGIILYFVVLGFLAGYLLTRVYVALMFKYADELVRQQGQILRLPSGKKIDAGNLALLQQSAIEDLRKQVSDITPDAVSEASPQPTAATPSLKSLLWVDDNPSNNTLLVEQLVRAGVRVEQVRSTADAEKALGTRTYDVVISDMSRREQGQVVDDAGIRLASAMRAEHPGIPLLIYCGTYMAGRYGEAARAAGVAFITSSATRLLARLTKIINVDLA